MSNWITTRELAEELGISIRHLHRLRDRRKFPKKGYWRNLASPGSRPDYRWNRKKIIELLDAKL